MNISELFEEIQNRFSEDDLNGEIALFGNCIIWSYTIDIDNTIVSNDESTDFDEDEISDDFEPLSSEELLQDAYNEDLEKIEILFDELDEANNWTFSESDIIDNMIYFKIF